MKGKFEITATISNNENALRIAGLLQNLIDNVPENELLSLELKVQKDSKFFKKVVKVLDNPFVRVNHLLASEKPS